VLVLTRKTQQQIQIGDNITITILRVKGNSVRIGIAAPRDARIIRSELNDKPLVAGQIEVTEATETGTKTTISETLAASPRLIDELEFDPDRVSAEELARPLANRVRVLTSQSVRYPERMTARSMRCMVGRK
jgi:carbon storage regulator CsrA